MIALILLGGIALPAPAVVNPSGAGPEGSSSLSGTYTWNGYKVGLYVEASIEFFSSTSKMHVKVTVGESRQVNCNYVQYTLSSNGKSMSIDELKEDSCVAAALTTAGASLTYIKVKDESYIRVKINVNGVTVKLKLSTSSAAEGLYNMVRNPDPDPDDEDETEAAERDRWFEEFVAAHGRTYTGAERVARRAVFEKNLDLIGARNADGDLGFHFINQFADMTADEFRATHLGYQPKANVTDARPELDLPITPSANAKSVDWRVASPAILTAVKNQGRCGSCWAFSATEQIETDVALATGKLYTLSPQQIVSCDTSDYGCQGGNTETAYKYVEKNGLELSSAYPYTSGTSGASGTCNANRKKARASIAAYHTVSSQASSEGKMLSQIASSPVSVCVDASHWQSYHRGVMGRSCGTTLDHCVQAVGYTAAKKWKNEAYWILRNSWTTHWGAGGYIYVEEGLDACGVAKDATIVSGAKVQMEEALEVVVESA
jgi:hypothetical protein